MSNKISLAVTSYNRSNKTVRSFSNVLSDDRITEIIIVDDHSDEKTFNDLSSQISLLGCSKLKIHRNTKNLGAFLNKCRAIDLASNDWIILLDSDNIIDVSYLDSLPTELDEKTFYLPSVAECSSPNLDYSRYSGKLLGIDDFRALMHSQDPIDLCLINTGNYLVNKRTYTSCVKACKNLINPLAVDVLYLLCLCFKNEKNFKLNVVTGLKYQHDTTSNKSWYRQNASESEKIAFQLRSMI
jgi:glycosyltransferase involved in cell wall biosynthesis|tara:strand:+ start:13480 stop:14202 length:723 start_codon:yes stop_codon:yes gene_type:complete